MENFSLELLRELTEAPGLPGHEDQVRKLVAEKASPFAQTSRDRMGNIICKKTGTADAPRVMVPGHMDEIGFVVKGITDDGYLRFAALGGWWDHVVLAQRVVVHTRKGELPGIIGSKPPHILTEEERRKLVKREDMFVDVGAKDKKEATGKLGIRVGDPIVPVCPFSPMKNNKLLMGKAFDDRLGVALFIDLLRKLARTRHPNSVFGVGTVQEEVGTRGAETAADAVQPDVALVLDVGIATDTPASSPRTRTRAPWARDPRFASWTRG